MCLGKDGKSLYEQSGYGSAGQTTASGSPRRKHSTSSTARRSRCRAIRSIPSLLQFADQPNFMRSFLVYRDLRERGYVVQTGPHDFRVFRRGEKPGKGESLYLVRVLSERDPIRFGKLIEEVVASRNMRKQYVLAVVDDEDELTYYEIKLPKLADACSTLPALGRHDAVLVGKSAMVRTPAGSDLELAGYGKRLRSRTPDPLPRGTALPHGEGDDHPRAGEQQPSARLNSSPLPARPTRNWQ